MENLRSDVSDAIALVVDEYVKNGSLTPDEIADAISWGAIDAIVAMGWEVKEVVIPRARSWRSVGSRRMTRIKAKK